MTSGISFIVQVAAGMLLAGMLLPVARAEALAATAVTVSHAVSLRPGRRQPELSCGPRRRDDAATPRRGGG